MSPASEPAQPDEETEQKIGAVDSRVLEALLKTLRENLKTVFEANRFLEERTTLHNQAGANNLTEALSHIGTLAEEAHRLSYEDQMAQVALLDDHLRRSMMEASERLVKARLGQLRKRWREYQRKAVPLSRRGRLRGVKTYEEVLVISRRLALRVEEGRSAKRGTDWEAWKRGAACLAQACDDAEELLDALEQALGAAQQYRRFRLGLIVGVGLGLAGLGLGVAALV
jgi:hypothetical protein